MAQQMKKFPARLITVPTVLVNYPTDINLLLDAMGKVITLTAQWCECFAISDWRQHAYNARHVKRLMRSRPSPSGLSEGAKQKMQQDQIPRASAEKRSPHH